MIFLHNQRHNKVPGLNTSSLPDLIFTVLFFFIIVTQMRSVPVKVRYRVPAGTELTKLTKKSAVTYIYVGKPMKGMTGEKGKPVCIQLNDKYSDVSSVTDYVIEERSRMTPEDARIMSVSIKADRNTDMGTITDIKIALRQANVYRINYSAVNRK